MEVDFRNAPLVALHVYIVNMGHPRTDTTLVDLKATVSWIPTVVVMPLEIGMPFLVHLMSLVVIAGLVMMWQVMVTLAVVLESVMGGSVVRVMIGGTGKGEGRRHHEKLNYSLCGTQVIMYIDYNYVTIS